MFFEKMYTWLAVVGCASVHSLSEVMVMGSNVKPQILKSKQCNVLCPWDHLHCTDDKHVPLFTPQLRWDRQGEDYRVTITTSHAHCIIKKIWFLHKEMSQTRYITSDQKKKKLDKLQYCITTVVCLGFLNQTLE